MTIELDKLGIHSACANSPHPCFPCKMKMWREGSYSPFKRLQPGWADLPSTQLRAQETVAQAKAAGREIHLADDKYRWV